MDLGYEKFKIIALIYIGWGEAGLKCLNPFLPRPTSWQGLKALSIPTLCREGKTPRGAKRGRVGQDEAGEIAIPSVGLWGREREKRRKMILCVHYM